MGLPVQLPGETYPGNRQVIESELAMTDTGCFGAELDGEFRFVIWPRDSALADPVRLPDGSELEVGDDFEAIGAVTPTAPLVADRAGYWAHAIGFCAPDADTVLVLDEVRPREAAE